MNFSLNILASKIIQNANFLPIIALWKNKTKT